MEASNLVHYLSDIISRPHSWTIEEYDALINQFDSITANVKEFIIERKRLVKSSVSSEICQSIEYQGKRSYQEDRMICCQSMYRKNGIEIPYRIYAVFDGHRDVDVAAYLAEHFCNAISKHLSVYDNPSEAIKSAFIYLDHQIYMQKLVGGSTATGAVIIDDTTYIFNLGDSRTIFFDEGRTLVTRDHKPTNHTEMIRIHNFGFSVIDGRIVAPGKNNSPRPGGLAVSRGFGDVRYKLTPDGKFECLLGAVSCLPDLMICGLEAQSYIFSASDGLWDVFSSDQIVKMLINDPSVAINKLFDNIKSNPNISDNVSAVFTKTN